MSTLTPLRQAHVADRNDAARWITRPSGLATAIVIATAVLAACGQSSSTSDDTVVDEPATTTTTLAALDEEPSTPDDDAPEPTDVGFTGGQLSAGERYSTSNLGVTLEFTTPRDVYVPHHRPGIVVMIDGFDPQTGEYPPERGVVIDIRRWSGWSNREEAVLTTPAASLDPYDIDGWLASNDVVLLSDDTRDIAGREARVFDVAVDLTTSVQAPVRSRGQCFDDWQPCFHIGADASGDELNRFDWVSAERTTRFYLLPIEGSEPLLINVGAAPDSRWFDEVESTFIESLVVGPDRPPIDPN